MVKTRILVIMMLLFLLTACGNNGRARNEATVNPEVSEEILSRNCAILLEQVDVEQTYAENLNNMLDWAYRYDTIHSAEIRSATWQQNEQPYAASDPYANRYLVLEMADGKELWVMHRQNGRIHFFDAIFDGAPDGNCLFRVDRD